MRYFKLYWKDGSTEVIKGKDFNDAMRWAGHDSAGCQYSLDYYEEVQQVWESIR